MIEATLEPPVVESRWRQPSTPHSHAEFQAYKQQADFITCTAKYPAFIAGRGAGKTASGAIKAVSKALRPNARGIIGAPTFPMLEQAAKPEFLRMLNKVAAVDRRAKWFARKSENKVIIPYLNSEVLFVTLDNYDRVRGINADWGWLDEFAYLPNEAWRVVVACVRIVLDGQLPQLFGTTTPKGRNWVYDEFVVKTLADPSGRRQKRYKIFKASSYDNPFIYADYVEDLGYSGRFAEQEIGGEFVAYEGLVYSGFDRSTMIARALDRWQEGDLIPAINTAGWRSIIGGDIGTRNPTAIVTLRVSPNNEQVHCAREFYMRGLGSADIIEAFKRQYREELNTGHQIEGLYLDPSAAGYIQDLLEADLPVFQANNDVIEGIGRMTSVLANGYTIDPSCVNTMAEYDAYSYSEKTGQLNSDKPVKQFDHAMDAHRYGVMAIPWFDRVIRPVDDDVADAYFGFTGV